MKRYRVVRSFLALFGIVLTVLLIFGGVVLAEKTTKKSTLPIEDVHRFTSAISQIKSFYVEPVSDNELFDNAIHGMLQGLDPHSDYLNKEEFKVLTSSTRGEFGGVGIEVTMEHDVIKVITPLDDSPAAKAGIKPGDLIVKIDDTPIRGLSLYETVKKMRGKKNTNVVLTVIRKGSEKPLIFKVTRDVIKVKSVKGELLEKGYGYIRVSHFQVSTSEKVKSKIKWLKKESGGKLNGLILDLRNNPGGLLDSAIDTSDAFLDSRTMGLNKLIVYTEGRVPGANFQAMATPGDILGNVPIVILVNEGSASGAEIVAGALQDHKRALVIGRTTFGKGSVQTVLPLDSATGIKLTTALYYTPLGGSIQARGIVPDIVIQGLIIAKSKAGDDEITLMKEADLVNHLKNNKMDLQNNNDGKLSSQAKALLKNDHMLYEAMHILKGLAIVHAHQQDVKKSN